MAQAVNVRRHKSPLSETTMMRLEGLKSELWQMLRHAPHTGRLWLDILLLFAAAIAHHALLPSLVFTGIPIDLLTPWLVVGFVRQHWSKAIVLLLVGALLFELHTAAPAGIYLTSYWILFVIIQLVRDSLSWWHVFPWLVTLAASSTMVVLFETFVRGILSGGLQLPDLQDLGQIGARIVFSTAVGMLLCRRYQLYGLDAEPE